MAFGTLLWKSVILTSVVLLLRDIAGIGSAPPSKLQGLLRSSLSSQYLLAEVALHNLDVVLTDTPLISSLSVKAYNHLLGECGVSFFGVEKLAKPLQNSFP